MKDISNQWVKLKEALNDMDYKEIDTLQNTCIVHDKTSLKLELDYKLMSCTGETDSIRKINEFLYYNGTDLIGYIGICCFGGSLLEVNGMVHPDYRRRGVFRQLYELVKQEWKRRECHKVLLLCDRQTASGQETIKTTGAIYESSEYEMYLNMDFMSTSNKALSENVIFRKAINKDAKEIAHLDAICFGNDDDETNLIIPEEEEKRGNIIYMLEDGGKTVGKARLQIEHDRGGIYGVGILPEYRGKGYGRAIILKSIEQFKQVKIKRIMLQVATQNESALNLYKSCGFEVTSTMDYYQLSY